MVVKNGLAEADGPSRKNFLVKKISVPFLTTIFAKGILKIDFHHNHTFFSLFEKSDKIQIWLKMKLRK